MSTETTHVMGACYQCEGCGRVLVCGETFILTGLGRVGRDDLEVVGSMKMFCSTDCLIVAAEEERAQILWAGASAVPDTDVVK